MKKMHIILMSGTLALFSQSVFAISEAYREQLEESGCTQVTEASGECQPGHSRHHHHYESEANRRSVSSHEQATRDIAYNLESHIAGKYQGEAVDYMEDHGWHAANEEHSRWRKAGFIVDFDMTNTGKLAGVVVR